MDIKCAIIELKPNSRHAVKEWSKTLNERKDEVLETLKQEGIKVESAFLTAIEDKDYLIYYVRAENVHHAIQTTQTSSLNIDIYHKKFKKNTWNKHIETQLLLDVTTD